MRMKMHLQRPQRASRVRVQAAQVQEVRSEVIRGGQPS
jgi:hypothetical protein